MNRYYAILPGAGIGGKAGVAFIKNHTKLDLLPDQGWVDNWETKQFTLKNGRYTDYLAANIGCRLCSEKFHSTLERCKSPKDVLQWLPAEVENESGEKRVYYVLHFPVLNDMLDKTKSKYAGNILTKHVIDTKLCIGHDVFSYIKCSSLSFIVSAKVRKELKKENCQGLVYLDITFQNNNIVLKVIQKLTNILNRRTKQKKDLKREPSQSSMDLTCLQNLNLPNKLIAFIRAGKFLSYNKEKSIIRNIEIVSLDSLLLGRIYVEPGMKSSKKGYYTIPVVDLIAECEGFDPWGLLVWLPDVQMFGTWDSDHRKLQVFPKARWEDIVSDPLKYLNAQWEPEKVENIIFVPNDKYIFTEEAEE